MGERLRLSLSREVTALASYMRSPGQLSSAANVGSKRSVSCLIGNWTCQELNLQPGGYVPLLNYEVDSVGIA